MDRDSLLDVIPWHIERTLAIYTGISWGAQVDTLRGTINVSIFVGPDAKVRDERKQDS